jgi:hypothetical protein
VAVGCHVWNHNHRIGYFTLDNAINNDTAVQALASRYGFNENERRIRYAPHFIHLTVKALFYGEESKDVQMKDLLDDLDSATLNEKEAATRLVTANEPPAEEDFTSESEQDNENNDVSSFFYITPESLDQYRKDGPFGKLHNIGVHLRQSSQLQQAFREAQKPCNLPLA